MTRKTKMTISIDHELAEKVDKQDRTNSGFICWLLNAYFNRQKFSIEKINQEISEHEEAIEELETMKQAEVDKKKEFIKKRIEAMRLNGLSGKALRDSLRESAENPALAMRVLDDE